MANDFRDAARKLKTYTATEKTTAAKGAINRIAPRERYTDIGGLHGIKDEVIKEITLALDTNLAAKAAYVPPKGFVFFGPPGTGKTLLVKAIAGENEVWFYNVNGPSILQGHYGDPEKTVRDIFEDARKNVPAIVFFDEIDSIADWRFKDYDVYVELVTPAKGMEKQVVAPGITRSPVSGPSAGLSIAVAMLSAFLKAPVDPTVIMTGAITAQGEVWPVGGLDYRGMGKIEAALADRYARRVLMPKYNYDRLGDFDTEKMLLERGIKIMPVQAFLEAAVETLQGFASEKEIMERLKLVNVSN